MGDAYGVVEGRRAAGVDLSLVDTLADAPLECARECRTRSLADHEATTGTFVVAGGVVVAEIGSVGIITGTKCQRNDAAGYVAGVSGVSGPSESACAI